MVKKKRSMKHILSKKRHVLIIIAGLIAVGILGAVIFRFVERQENIQQLSNVGKDLRYVYDRLVVINKSNIRSSTFRNACGESSVEIGRGQITCWVEGRIELNDKIDLSVAAKNMDNAFADSKLISSSQKALVFEGKYGSGVSLVLKAPYQNMVCDGDYSQNSVTGKWVYLLNCREVVPDFLPGYIVEN